MNFDLPSSCPFSIRLLLKTSSFHYYLIREHDHYDQYPNIYAKVFQSTRTNGNAPEIVVLSDTGTGLVQQNGDRPANELSNDAMNSLVDSDAARWPSQWTIASLLACTINPDHTAPYIILTTHCHFDHIMGIQHFIDAGAHLNVVSSSHDKSYLTPWANLQHHSLCDRYNMRAPIYEINWIGDREKLSEINRSKSLSLPDLGILVLHTPGHTPDSLAWYDCDTHMLNVGDTFYERESSETRSGSGGQWDREPAQPVILVQDSNVNDWQASMASMLEFVRTQNAILAKQANATGAQDGFGTPVDCELEELEEPNGNRLQDQDKENKNWISVSFPCTNSHNRVRICAAHVTISTDAELAIIQMQAFMARVLRDEVPRRKIKNDDEHTGDTWLWDDCLCKTGANGRTASCRFSVQAPLAVMRSADSFIREPIYAANRE